MIFPNPDKGMTVEPLPSTQVPYGLRNTLGYLAASVLNHALLNHHIVVSSILWCIVIKTSMAIKYILNICFHIFNQFFSLVAVIKAIAEFKSVFAA